jgi:hypothetical protein
LKEKSSGWLWHLQFQRHLSLLRFRRIAAAPMANIHIVEGSGTGAIDQFCGLKVSVPPGETSRKDASVELNAVDWKIRA